MDACSGSTRKLDQPQFLPEKTVEITGKAAQLVEDNLDNLLRIIMGRCLPIQMSVPGSKKLN